MKPDTLLLGVDGGGTQCRARLCSPDGAELARAVSGPANIRLGLDESVNSVFQAVRQCLAQAALLAGLVKSPSSYAPTVSPARAKNRRNLVLNAMLEQWGREGANTGVAFQTKLTLLGVIDRGRRDPNGKVVSKVVDAFRKL